jgi:hypothetical protein
MTPVLTAGAETVRPRSVAPPVSAATLLVGCLPLLLSHRLFHWPAAFADVLYTPFLGIPHTRAATFSVTMIVLVVAVAVLTRRWWRYQLPAGALLLLLLPQLEPVSLSGATIVLGVFTAGSTLVLFGALGGATQLIRLGHPGYGAAVAGVAVGTRLVGSEVSVNQAGHTAGDLIWTTLALVGLVVTGVTARRHPAAPAEPAGDLFLHSGRLTELRTTVAGLLLATAGLLPLLNLTGEQFARHGVGWAVLGVGGLAFVVAALAVAGTLPLVAGSVLGAAVVGAGTAIYVTMVALSDRPVLTWTVALSGVAVGTVAGISRFRAPITAVLALVTALLLVPGTLLGSHGQADLWTFVTTAEATPSRSALLLALLLATVTGLVGAVSVGLSGRDGSATHGAALESIRALPVVAGPALALTTMAASLATADRGVAGRSGGATGFGFTPGRCAALIAFGGLGVLGFAVLTARIRGLRQPIDGPAPD